MTRGATPATPPRPGAPSAQAGARREAMDHEGPRAVVDAGSVPRRDHGAGESGFSSSIGSSVVFGRGCSCDTTEVSAPSRPPDRSPRRKPAALAAAYFARARGEAAEATPARRRIGRDVVGGLRHGVRAESLPSSGSQTARRSSNRRPKLAAKALSLPPSRKAPGSCSRRRREEDRPRRRGSRARPRSRLQPRAAQAVDRQAAAIRQPRQQRGHARDVALVLARLVGAAEDHFVDPRA